MPTEVPTPVQSLVDAINAGDTEAFVDSFIEVGFINDWGRVLSRADGIRSWAETDAIGKNARIEILTASVDGDTVTTEFDWASDRFTGQSTGIFVIDGERLASFTIPPH